MDVDVRAQIDAEGAKFVDRGFVHHGEIHGAGAAGGKHPRVVELVRDLDLIEHRGQGPDGLLERAVLAALEQQHRPSAGAQLARERGPGRTGADDDGIERIVGFGGSHDLSICNAR